MSLRIIAVGKRHEDWIVEGVKRYEKRLKKPWDIEWIILPHSSFDGMRAREEESERIISKLDSRDTVVLLDETGQNISSPTLSAQVEAWHVDARQVVFIIGGAYGVDERVKKRAVLVWSLSKLVFPHQLVRLILAEQIYRASEIMRGSAYHHE